MNERVMRVLEAQERVCKSCLRRGTMCQSCVIEPVAELLVELRGGCTPIVRGSGGSVGERLLRLQVELEMYIKRNAYRYVGAGELQTLGARLGFKKSQVSYVARKMPKARVMKIGTGRGTMYKWREERQW